ncbi:DNA repair exonuclease [Xanthomonas campestris pv. raphani]|uniref:metallophosphoesterase family protein n=1 Tax=Xanthomonas campestris TaxID=339 RepID=UPI002B22CA61|nr:DNA repair exonuclease [Xanthomonas campestris]MEA9906203.1 DNA repair exonuclease [Xanthomonas campestris pv. raphani]
MNFHYLHAADIHLDRSLNGLRPREGLDLQLAPRIAFANLVDEAIRSHAAFVVLAGDIYDGAWKDSSTGLFFNRQMGRLRAAGIPVYVMHGNHDAQSAMPKTLHPPDNVRVFRTDAAHTFLIDELKVALHGQSFREADTRENLVDNYPAAVPGLLNIGVLHTALEGTPPHAPYAPCSLAQLRAFGYDYWALGHVHSHKVLSEDPWVVFPGNLQGLHVNESGSRGAVRVSVVDGRIERVERLLVDVLRWAFIEVDLDQVSERSEAWSRLARALQAALREADGRHLCARIIFTGATPLHAWLILHQAQLEEEVIGQAAGVSDALSIERIKVHTKDPSHEVGKDHGDALADLQTYLDEAATDSEFLSGLRDVLAPAIAELPEVDADAHPDLARLRAGDFSGLAASKKNELLYRIGES